MRERINLNFGDPNAWSTVGLTIFRELSLKNYLKFVDSSVFISSISILRMKMLTNEKAGANE